MRIIARVLTSAVLLLSPVMALAQTPSAPTREAPPSTPAQDAAIRTGVALHDAGKFDEAIAKYEEVLKDSPENMTALYELAYSYAEKKDYARALEHARRGTTFKSDLLPMFYDLIGSSLDSSGQSQQAVAAYEQGIAIVPSAAMLHHNLAVTYLESLKQPDQARKALERGAFADPLEPSIQLLLGQVFNSGGYTTPALFAYATYLAIEPNGPRSLQAYGNWRAILKGGVDAPIDAGGAADQASREQAMRDRTVIRPRPAMTSRDDEGDFSDVDAQLPSSQRAFLAEIEKGATEIDALVAQLNRLLLFIEGRALGRDRNSFTAKVYLPFFRELKQKNYVELYVYWASQRAPVPGVREWLLANQARVREFVAWINQYNWPAA